MAKTPARGSTPVKAVPARAKATDPKKPNLPVNPEKPGNGKTPTAVVKGRQHPTDPTRPANAPSELGAPQGAQSNDAHAAYLAYAQAVADSWTHETGVTKTVDDVLAAGGSWAFDPSVDAGAYRNMADAVSHPDVVHSGASGASGGGQATAPNPGAVNGGYSSGTSGPSWGSVAGSSSSDAMGYQAGSGGAGGFPSNSNSGGTYKVPAGLSTDQRNAYTALTSVFDSYGLGSLAPAILGYVQAGYDSQTTGYLLQQTPEYKQRFAGNTARQAAGLAVLSPAEYLSTERAYQDAARAYGLPSGFYDSPSDFANLIGADISPQEYQTRVSDAFKFAQSGNSEARSMLQSYYGVDASHIAAYFLDPTKAQAVLDRQAQAASLGGDAARQGVLASRGMAESYADQGVSDAQATQGFGQVSEALGKGQLGIAQRFGSDLSTTDLANDFVTNLASARRKRELVNQSEQALFSQNADAARGSFSTDNFGSY